MPVQQFFLQGIQKGIAFSYSYYEQEMLLNFSLLNILSE